MTYSIEQLFYLNTLGITYWEAYKNSPTLNITSHSKENSESEHTPKKPAETEIETEMPYSAASPSVANLNWETLEKQVAQCRLCSLSESRTQTVFGVGNKNADLMIVGEAPGFYEDQLGEPFVGRAGKLLDAMLKAFQLSRAEVYIANVLKCRPPNNRDPLPIEVGQCTPYLERQIALLAPRLIVALGRHSAHYLLETKTPLNRLRNEVHMFRATNIPLIVSYHPAYLLRNPLDKAKAWSDWQQIMKLLETVS